MRDPALIRCFILWVSLWLAGVPAAVAQEQTADPVSATEPNRRILFELDLGKYLGRPKGVTSEYVTLQVGQLWKRGSRPGLGYTLSGSASEDFRLGLNGRVRWSLAPNQDLDLSLGIWTSGTDTFSNGFKNWGATLNLGFLAGRIVGFNLGVDAGNPAGNLDHLEWKWGVRTSGVLAGVGLGLVVLAALFGKGMSGPNY